MWLFILHEIWNYSKIDFSHFMKEMPKNKSSLSELEASFQKKDRRLFDFDEDDLNLFPLKRELLQPHQDYVITELYGEGGVKNIFRAYHCLGSARTSQLAFKS